MLARRRGKDAAMAWDEQLADRVRAVVADRDDIDEKPMFGGLCLLAHGNMFAGVQSDALMLRVGPERHEEALARPHARVMDFTGRSMRGYVYVDPPGFSTEAQLREWVDLSLAFVDTLPAK
jgi:TfoX/Sxy family transcriptional regulator of competence genes